MSEIVRERVPKLSEGIANQIRKSIARGEVKPGEFLPSEAEMLVQFGASRPTLREAIRILEVEGLISISQGARTGPVVKNRNLDMVTKATGIALQIRGATLGDVYEARSQIEPLAARMAAENRPKEAAAALRALIPSELALLAEDTRLAFTSFHRTLLDQSGNQTLSILGIALAVIVNRHSEILYTRRTKGGEKIQPRQLDVKRLTLAIRSFDRLAKLIEDGNAIEAENHWRRHMRNAAKDFPSYVSELAIIDILD